MMLQTPSDILENSLWRFKGDLSPMLSRLPEEVVRLILEHLGRESRSEALHLICVSRLIHRWILPVLYETICLMDASGLYQIQNNITAHPEPASHVRNVCLQLAAYRICSRGRASLARAVATFCSQCPHIRSIYLPHNTSLTFHHNIVQLPCLEELHYGPWALWPAEDIFALRTLTHLRLHTAYDSHAYKGWAPLCDATLGALPQLTHLAFGGGDGDAAAVQFAQEVLTARARRLVMLVIVSCLGEGDRVAFEEIEDPRLCILANTSHLNGVPAITQWEDAVRGRQGIWGIARIVMERHWARGGHGAVVGSL